MLKGFGERVKRARERLGISQRELGRRIGASAAYISDVERETTTPRTDKQEALCAELRIRREWLAIGQGPMTDEPQEPAIPQDWHEIEQEDRELLSALMRRLRCVRERHADPPEDQPDCDEPEQLTAEEALAAAERRVDDALKGVPGVERHEEQPTPRKRREEPS